jgi:hypothetical protein
MAAVTKRAIAQAKKIHKYEIGKYFSDRREIAAAHIQARIVHISGFPPANLRGRVWII